MGAGLLVAIGVLLRNPILARVLDSELTRMTGGDVEIVGARFDGLVRVRVDSIDIRAKGWSGLAGDVVHVENLVADLLPSTFLGMGFGFERINIEAARIRVAERAEDPTEINIASLRPPGDDDDDKDDKDDEDDDKASAITGLGSIVIDRLEIETGIAEGDEWKLVNVSVFQARVDAEPSPAGTHTFVLASVDDEASFDIATGTLDSASGGFTLRTDEVDLRRGASLALSATARAVVSAMEIDGILRTAKVEWRPGGVPSARLEIDDLAFSPPRIDGIESEWVRFGQGRIIDEHPPLPRIELARGSIILEGDVLEISGSGGRLGRAEDPESVPDFGLAASLRIELSGLVDELDGGKLTDWGDALLEMAPFSLEVELERFLRPDTSSEIPVDLPRVVASALEILTARSWDLTGSAFIRRERRDLDPDASGGDPVTIDAGAVLDIVDGVGMYENFEYPLRNVQARLSVDNEIIRIDRLVGTGPSGDRIRLQGEIDGTSDDAGVDLRLQSDSISLDDDMLAALPESTERGLRTLFDKVAAERLEAAGLLPDAAEYEGLEEQIEEQRRAALELPSDSPKRNEIDSTLARLETLAETGPFEIGGRGAIDLRIHRPRKLGHPVAVEGPIRLEDVGGIFSRFPYPVIVNRGEIILEDLAVILASPGLEVSTTRGGHGTITGRVDLPRDGRGGRDVLPSLELRIQNDRLSRCLLAAVPPEMEGRPSPASIPGWPGEVLAEAVEPVIAMGLSGRLDYVVRISTTDDGDATFAVVGNLMDGTARPDGEAQQTVAEAGLLWPRNFALEDVNANLRVDDAGLELASFSGRRGEGVVRARGLYDFQTERGRGIARLRDMDADEFLLDLIPAGSIDEAQRLWNRWNPEGRFNADLSWSRRASITDLELTAEPLWVEFETASGRTRFERERGRLHFHDGWIEIDDLAIELATDERLDGALRLEGGYGYEGNAGFHRLSGVLDTARFEAPALEEVLRLAAGTGVADWWLERSPEGRFEGRFDVITGAGEAPEFDLELIPSSFTLLSRSDDASSRGGGRVVGDGRIAIHDRRVEIGPIELEAEDGAIARFEVVVEDVERPELAARYGLSLPDTSVPEVGFMPPPFSSILQTEEVHASGVELEGTLLATYWRPEDLPESEDPDIPYLYEASGTLDFERLEWDLGGTPVVISRAEEGLAMSLEAKDGIPTDFDLEGRIPRIDVAERPVLGIVTRGRLDAETSPTSPRFLITGEDGTIGRGGVRFDAAFEPLVERYQFDVQLADVDLDALATVEPGVPTGEETPRSRTPGRVFARMSLDGLYDDSTSRVGRGLVTVRDASFAEDGALALLQLGQLLPPIRDELATASAEMWIDGGEVKLDPILLESETLTLEGTGELRLDDWRWALRLRPSGKVPGWSDLVSVISGTVAAIDVSGTPAEPVLEVVPLPILVPAEELPKSIPSSESTNSRKPETEPLP